MNYKLSPPPEVVRIARRLSDAGHEVWAVGGAVRDALAGLDPGDWDLTTSARPPQMRAVFRRIVPVGIEHGTVGIVGADGCMYEVTTFRRDVETDGRHAVVRFADTLEEDLARRDFTINAVAWNPLSGELRDPYQGRGDLERGVLRAVGEPAERFREDRLRVLRALRFAGRFALEVDPTTWDAARASAGELGMLSAERVREELFKVLGGAGSPSRAVELYARSGVLAHLYPELLPVANGGVGWSGRGWAEVLRVVDSLPRRRPLLRLAALFHALDAGADLSADRQERAAAAAARARQVMRRLKASNADTDLVVHLLAQDVDLPTGASDPAVRRWLRRVGPEHAHTLFRLRLALSREAGDQAAVLDALARVRRVARQRPPLAVSDLAIGGRELREAGIQPGPRYGEILAALLERVLDDPAVNRSERLLEILRAMEPS